jgi:WD40 repeat protein
MQSLCDAASLGSAASSICWEGCCQDVSRLYAGSDTGSIKLWDLDQGQGGPVCVRMPCSSSWLAAGHTLCGSHQGWGTLTCQNCTTCRAVAGTLKGHKAAPTCLSHCLHTGTLASGSQDTTVKLWDPRTKEAAATLKGQGAAITQVKLSPDGSLLVSGSEEGAIKVRAGVTYGLLPPLTELHQP